MRRRKQAVLLVVILAVNLACIHKASGPVTPWEKVTTENAILAQAINTVTHGTIAVQNSGLITVQQASPILQFATLAAQDQKQLTAILAQAPSATNIPAIQALVTQIGQSATTVVNSGGAGVKNPKSQQTISADIQAIVTAANLVLTSYQNAVGGQ